MAPLAKVGLALFCFSSFLPVRANNIVGCNDLACPYDNGEDRCTVGNHTFTGVGLAAIPDLPSSLQGLSLVKGVNISATGPKDAVPFTSVYYLGAPSNLDVSELAGCAVVFNNPPPKHFPGGDNGTDVEASQGTCSDVIEQRCIDTLTAQARKITGNSTSSCSVLESELKQSAFEECRDFAGSGAGLGNFTVWELSDLSPINSSQNSSSDCWPVTPKSDNLVEIGSDVALGNNTAAANLQQVYKITPVLTAFFGQSQLVNKTTAQLTCLKVVTEEHPDDADDGSKNAAAPLMINLLGVGVAAFATLLFTL